MKNDRFISRKVAGLTACLAGLLGGVSETKSQQMVIKTHLPQRSRVMIADGRTVYRIDVRADTTEYPETQISGVDWNLTYPPALLQDGRIYDAQFPDPEHPQGPSENPEDFFSLFDMFVGWMDISPYPLGPNQRHVDDDSQGPFNRTFDNGLLGVYRVIVNENAPTFGQGVVNFGVVQFVGVALRYPVFRLSEGTVRTDNDVFYIVTRSQADISDDWRIDLGDYAAFRDTFTGAGIPRSDDERSRRADFDRDGDVDLHDFRILQQTLDGRFE